jgi:hypothetical protein
LLHGLAGVALQFGEQQHVMAVELFHSSLFEKSRISFSPDAHPGVKRKHFLRRNA